MESALTSLSVHLGKDLSETTVSRFKFLYENWDFHRIYNFTYCVIPMTLREKHDDSYKNPDRTAVVDLLFKLMPKQKVIVEDPIPKRELTDESLLEDYYDIETDSGFFEPQLCLVWAWYFEGNISKSVALMKRHADKLDNIYERDNTTLLLYGCERGMLDFVTLLIKNGANPSHPNNVDAVRLAILGHNSDQVPDMKLLKLLTKNGAPPPKFDQEMLEKIQYIKNGVEIMSLYSTSKSTRKTRPSKTRR